MTPTPEDIGQLPIPLTGHQGFAPGITPAGADHADPPAIHPYTRHDELAEQFVAFDLAHPEVWRLFKRFTLDIIGRGFKHYGAKAIMERVRWETDHAHGASATQFKVNDHYTAFYARRFMARIAVVANTPTREFFRTRKQTSEDAPPTNLPEQTPAEFDGARRNTP